ncbi:MAG: hypothetical protein ACI4RR_00360 [Eubacterium sp.]
MSSKFEKLNSKQMPKFKYEKKERLTIAALTSLAVTFVYLLFGPIDIYANNKEEFAFAFSDLALPVILIFLASFAVLSVLLYFLKGKVLNVITSVLLSLTLYMFVDSALLNKVSFVSGDVVSNGFEKESISAILCVLVLSIMAFVSMAIGKKWKGVAVFLAVLILGMNGSGLVSDFATKDLFGDNSINCDYVLSEKNLFEVSEKENVVYFLFDRFDTKYYDAVVEDDPEFFDRLDGFTYYDSAVSKYTRTFPGVSYMITGKEYDGSYSPKDFLSTAYQESDFLKDLKSNGYNINIYSDRYYEYTDAKVLLGIADNVEKSDGYEVKTRRLLEYFYSLSFKRNSSYLIVDEMYQNGNNGTVSKLSKILCESGIYHDDDEKMYNKLTSQGLKYSGEDKNYIFMYLHGCHTPFILDENCQRSDDADYISQTKGSFNLIYKYIDEMKRLGVYDNSTIIIAGDHGMPYTDVYSMNEFSERGYNDDGTATSIFVKPKNADNPTLKTSSAQVSVDDIIPFIVKDTGMKTDVDYGTSITDVGENENRDRVFYQSMYNVYDHKLILNKFIINGDAHNIDNWTLSEQIKTGYSWY